MEHTKLPWKTDGDRMITGRCVGGCNMQEDDFMVAQIRGWGHLQYLGEEKAIEIQKANAEFIVEAVNNYDRLKKENENLQADKKALVEVLKELMEGFKADEKSFPKTIAQIKKAILQAEGE